VGMAWNEVILDMLIQRCPIKLDLQELFLAWGNTSMMVDTKFASMETNCDTITVA